jgi:hypothetical protein
MILGVAAMDDIKVEIMLVLNAVCNFALPKRDMHCEPAQRGKPEGRSRRGAPKTGAALCQRSD